MVKVKYIIISLVLAAAGIAIFFFVFESPEAQVKKRFEFVAEKMSKSPGESPILSGAKVKSLKKVIENPCLIDFPEYSYSRTTDAETLSAYVFTMRSRYSKISLKFHDYYFDYIDEESARVIVTAGLRGTLQTGEAVEDIHEVACSLKKTDNIWKFIKIEAVQVLTK